jgi:S-DNA-T family DNA segregation ATPase FtsK/SpoIIIE
MAKKSSSNPLPPRVVRLLRESTGLALLGVALYLVLIFYGYERADPGWSHRGAAIVQNPGGPAGAWLADLLLYLFGVSA